MNIFKPTGNTPFEIAEARLASGQAQVKSAAALHDLIKVIQECDQMIEDWRAQLKAGSVDPETQALAIQALKEKEACNIAIINLTQVMHKHFNFEA
jgi:hypothetical protein